MVFIFFWPPRYSILSQSGFAAKSAAPILRFNKQHKPPPVSPGYRGTAHRIHARGVLRGFG
jgi:hypothetical protein